MEKQRDLIRSVFTGSSEEFSVCFIGFQTFNCELEFDAALSSRAENVSNFMEVESIFGPVISIELFHPPLLYCKPIAIKALDIAVCNLLVMLQRFNISHVYYCIV